jgi:hypothetical protein
VDFTAPLRGAKAYWSSFPRVSPGAIFMSPLRGAGDPLAAQ